MLLSCEAFVALEVKPSKVCIKFKTDSMEGKTTVVVGQELRA